MTALPYRQVHLDFHTSEHIPGIGSRFSKQQFQQALQAGHVDSITLFSKCHHGWSYHPTRANEQHPGLSFDLLGAQLEACREIGVRAPVYISAGHDEKDARRHPDWVVRSEPDAVPSFDEPMYHLLCFNSPYLERLLAQTAEVMERYHPCGVFLDICAPHICYCPACRAQMKREGLSAAELSEKVYAHFCRSVRETVGRYDPEATVFFNGGHITRGRRDIAHTNTHLELESLPTGGWGYDHFPLSAAYARTLGMDFLGMTGKFHGSWGDFGGYKHPNALRYETALSLAVGAKCSVGDQLHPDGEMNMSTYRLIGAAYAGVEEKEPWCCGAQGIADIALLSAEACGGGALSDTGANRILLEGHYLYDVVDGEADFSRYRLLILPDEIRLDEALGDKLRGYLEKGGCLLASGESGLFRGEDRFALELGVDFAGQEESCPSYMMPGYDAVNGEGPYVMFEPAVKVAPRAGARPFASIQDSYFNRTAAHFCSHRQTPNNADTTRPAAYMHGHTAYIPWPIFREYAEKGSYHIKELARQAIDALLDGRRSAEAALPDRGVFTLTRQPEGHRLVCHLLYTHTSQRGDVEVIEDIVPLREVAVWVRMEKPPRRVNLAPQGTQLPFRWEGGKACFTVPEVYIHQMAVLDE